MSIEQQISELRDAIVHLTAAIKAQPVTPVTSAPVPAPAPMTAMEIASAPFVAPVVTFGKPPVTVAEPAPVPPPVTVSAAPVMPPPPTFTAAPAPEVATNVLPFSDSKGLIEYVMAAYKAMGPTKGAGIQGVLVGMGLANINDVQPAQYGDFYVKVEALK
jgi:hypothetical protein